MRLGSYFVGDRASYGVIVDEASWILGIVWEAGTRICVAACGERHG